MKAILSVSPDWGIADIDGNLLYRDKQDMKLFRGLTYNSMVLAGHNTAVSIPGGLEGRDCFCMSDDPPSGWKKYRGVIDDNTWLIGGAKTLTRFLDRIEEFWLSMFIEPPKVKAGIKLCDKSIERIESLKRLEVASFTSFTLYRFVI